MTAPPPPPTTTSAFCSSTYFSAALQQQLAWNFAGVYYHGIALKYRLNRAPLYRGASAQSLTQHLTWQSPFVLQSAHLFLSPGTLVRPGLGPGSWCAPMSSSKGDMPVISSFFMSCGESLQSLAGPSHLLEVVSRDGHWLLQSSLVFKKILYSQQPTKWPGKKA